MYVRRSVRLMMLSSTRSRRGFDGDAGMGTLGEEVFGEVPISANCSEEEISRLGTSLPPPTVLLAVEAGASTGNGNSVCFSVGGPGVGGSMALRALLLSADMRLLSSISPALGVGDSSSKTLLRPKFGAGGGLSVMLGVTMGGTPSRHCTRARASFNGPTGFATKPMLLVDVFGGIERSKREVCEQSTRTVGPFPMKENLRDRVEAVGADSFDMMIFALCSEEMTRNPYHLVRKVVMESLSNFAVWKASGSVVFESKPWSDTVWPITLARRVVID
jgi:hypothetical protein